MRVVRFPHFYVMPSCTTPMFTFVAFPALEPVKRGCVTAHSEVEVGQSTLFDGKGLIKSVATSVML